MSNSLSLQASRKKKKGSEVGPLKKREKEKNKSSLGSRTKKKKRRKTLVQSGSKEKKDESQSSQSVGVLAFPLEEKGKRGFANLRGRGPCASDFEKKRKAKRKKRKRGSFTTLTWNV